MKNIRIGGLCIALIMMCANGSAAEKAPQKVIDLAHTVLVKLGSDPIIVKAVKEQNAKGMTLAKIKEMDATWTSTPGINTFMKSLMTSPCGRHLQQMQAGTPYYSEIFVMDNLGANVAMTDKTSDYWQGDEPKFNESYKGGAGAVHISSVKFDDSTQAYLVQVSVPVMDAGKAIGAVTIGVDVDKIE